MSNTQHDLAAGVRIECGFLESFEGTKAAKARSIYKNETTIDPADLRRLRDDESSARPLSRVGSA